MISHFGDSPETSISLLPGIFRVLDPRHFPGTYLRTPTSIS